ncbi:MAG: YiiD C-terminal domain-containing protein [Leucothrix sp.]
MANTELSADWLTQHIRDNIPLAYMMQFEIVDLQENAIAVAAPLAPNINIHGTGFAGSLYALAVLTSWGLTSAIVLESGFKADVVIAKAEINYRKPVDSEIKCVCLCSQEAKSTFINTLQNKAKGRLLLTVKIGDSDEAILKASMVAIKQS